MTPTARTPAPFDLGHPFAAVRQEIDRLFADMAGLPAAAPRMDVTETDDAIVVTAELPGLEDEDVDVTLTGNLLTLRGEKKIEREEKGETRHVIERATGRFARALEVPAGLDPQAVKATMDKGVLTVTLPKPAAAPATGQRIVITRAA
ncbi:heat-shock protein [Zavarzinia compransoris]|uniref:Heat-shock protein n=2 Tax=Zavarzinia compransoris TaxID=1264899 RepID=A0A317DYY6_9PROT|nr:heat-shock protein [Zavarzinia compransoris]